MICGVVGVERNVVVRDRKGRAQCQPDHQAQALFQKKLQAATKPPKAATEAKAGAAASAATAHTLAARRRFTPPALAFRSF
jgi:hypothetical protein